MSRRKRKRQILRPRSSCELMPIKFNCPACAAAIKAPETHAGQTLPCPKCSHAVTVPQAGAENAPPGEVPPADADAKAGGGELPPDLPPQFPPVDSSPVETELPEIVTGADVPPPAPTPAVTAPTTPEPTATVSTPPLSLPAHAANAFAAPQTVARSTSVGDLTDVRIVDIEIPFWSLFKFTFRLFVCSTILGVALYAVILAIIVAIAALLGAAGLM